MLKTREDLLEEDDFSSDYDSEEGESEISDPYGEVMGSIKEANSEGESSKKKTGSTGSTKKKSGEEKPSEDNPESDESASASAKTPSEEYLEPLSERKEESDDWGSVGDPERQSALVEQP